MCGMNRDLIIWGGTGNFKVLCELLGDKFNILGYFDRNINVQDNYQGITYLGSMDSFEKWLGNGTHANRTHFICSMGHGLGKERIEIHCVLKKHGLLPITAIHDTAFVAANSQIEEGSQIYAKSAVCVDAKIGRCCIINTCASVDHECELEEGVSIGPGARLAGLVKIEKYADIYTGAIVLPKIVIGESAIVGAGSVVIRDVEPHCVVAGNPAKVIKYRGL
jgi:sugar O-acyltransferase (sialic acid O-acetyltransferase NeuD family)